MTRRQQTDGDSGRTVTISSRTVILGFVAVAVLAAAYWLGTRAGSPGAGGAAQVTAAVPGSGPALSQGPPGLAFTVPRGDATAAAVPPVTGGARLAVDYSRLDFGQKSFGEPVDARFTLTNVGDAPLTLDPYVGVTTVVGC
jgi:hypothetical protein